MILRVGHLYPEYLNIYADRGNIAVLERRAAARGHELEIDPITLGSALGPGAHDLLYVGGGQDHEQAMIANDLAARRESVLAAVDSGAALLAVCGGYQLLGRGYRGREGSWMDGVGLFPHETVAGDTRMIGDVLLESTLPEAAGRTIAGFENHAGRTVLDPGAEPLGRVVEILQTGSNDVYVVRSESGELLIPATQDVVRAVDLEHGVLTVELIEGLR